MSRRLATVWISCSALAVLVLWFLLQGDPGASPSTIRAAAGDLPRPNAESGAISAPLRAPALEAERVRVALEASVAAADLVPVAPDLIALLAAIGLADAQRDDAFLAARLAEVVGLASRLLETVDLLESGRLHAIPHARRGALVALTVGVARWSRGGGPEGADGVSWTSEVLLRLPRLDGDTRAELAARIADAEVAGRGLLDGRYLAIVLDLCSAHPEDASIYTSLLRRIADDPASLRPYTALLQAALVEPSAPALRAFALRVLFVLEPAIAAGVAVELLAAARGDPLLRGEVARAIAQSAPPELAVELLLELHDPSLHAAFGELADRPGAPALLRDHYNRLAAAGTDSIGRRILVASMRAEDPGILIGIAESDPSPDVRQQAFLTGTLRPNDSVDGANALSTAYERRADPAVGIPTRGIVLSADNVVLNARGPARDAALALMERIARDSRNDMSDRLLALRRLRPHVAPESIADLGGLGEAPDETAAASLRHFGGQAGK
jgi:hypothetical protein